MIGWLFCLCFFPFSTILHLIVYCNSKTTSRFGIGRCKGRKGRDRGNDDDDDDAFGEHAQAGDDLNERGHGKKRERDVEMRCIYIGLDNDVICG